MKLCVGQLTKRPKTELSIMGRTICSYLKLYRSWIAFELSVIARCYSVEVSLFLLVYLFLALVGSPVLRRLRLGGRRGAGRASFYRQG